MQVIQERFVNLLQINLAIFIALVGSMTSVYASTDGDPYNSGYDHGCDDAYLDADDRYINEPGKGPGYHTEQFMDGYNDGFETCIGRNIGDGDGDGDESGERYYDGVLDWEKHAMT
jgi:hypothetical protein